MFIAALFTIARIWKQPEFLSTDELIKKMWYIYTVDYYSIITMNETGSFVEIWMGLTSINREGNGTPLQYSCLENPWMEESGGLQSMGSVRVGHD